MFLCFTLSALYARSPQYLALGGFLSSGLSMLFWIGIVNLFFQSAIGFNISLYLGLALFCGYVLYDTRK